MLITPSGTGSGDSTIAFTSGIYSGNFIVTKTYMSDVIYVKMASGSPEGKSNAFMVIGNEVAVSLSTGSGAASAPRVAIPDQTIDMFDLVIDNIHPTDDVTLSNLNIYIESSKNSQTFVANPSTLISAVFVKDMTAGGVQIGQNLSPNNSVDFVSIPVSATVPASGSVTLRVSVTISDISQAVVPNLLLRLGDVNGTRSGLGINPVNNYIDLIPVNDPVNYPDYLIRSGITNIRSSADKAAFNYPNPFNPRTQTTRIVFYSPVNSQTTIKIFTLTGKLVKIFNKIFTLTGKLVKIFNVQAVQGSNEVIWDGKNGRGSVVRNGVYVAVIMTQNGSKQMVKIAVVK